MRSKKHRVGSGAQHGPRLAGEILHQYLENSNEPLAVAYREHTAETEQQGWHPNTHLCVNLKTLLRSDRCVKEGKNYTGVLWHDVTCEEFRYDDHFTFVESEPQTTFKRNPQVFSGRYVTLTRWDDGSYRPNLKPMQIRDGFPVDSFALEVANEIRHALTGLIGKSK